MNDTSNQSHLTGFPVAALVVFREELDRPV